MRVYSSEASSLDHLHKIYRHVPSLPFVTPADRHTARTWARSQSSTSRLVTIFLCDTLSLQHALSIKGIPASPTVQCSVLMYSRYFDFFGKISFVAWNKLVNPRFGKTGTLYFDMLNKVSILPHLPKCHFASRPVARDGVTYNIGKNCCRFRESLQTIRLNSRHSVHDAIGTVARVHRRVLWHGDCLRGTPSLIQSVASTSLQLGTSFLEDPASTAGHLLRLFVSYYKTTRYSFRSTLWAKLICFNKGPRRIWPLSLKRPTGFRHSRSCSRCTISSNT